MVYIFVILYLLFLIYNYDIHNHRKKSFHFWTLMVFFSLMAGLSYRLGVDSIRYEMHFYNSYNVGGVGNLFSGELGVSGEEHLWALFNRICILLFGEFQMMKFILAVFVNGTVFWFLRKHSPALFTSILLYFLLMFANINYEVLRESMAISFFLIAFDKLDGSKKGLINYFLFLIPALFCHRFAFICLIFPLFLRVNYSRNFIFFLIATLIIIPFLSSFLNSFIEYNLLNEIFNDRLERLATSDTYGFHQMNIFGYIELFVLTLLPLLILLRYYQDGRCMSFALVYIIIILMRAGSLTILFRVNDYLFFPTVIALSGAIKNAVYHCDYSRQPIHLFKNGMIATVCAILFVGGQVKDFVQSDDFVMYYPYASVITKEVNKERETYYSYLIKQYY